jgi:predicted kinase
MSILNIRGTHGAGKSFIVHQLLKAPHEAIGDFGYHIPQYDCGVVGKYSTTCGGTDGIKTADEVVQRVRLFANTFRHVVFEGIIVSHTFQRYSELAKELEDKDFWFLFLNTPLEVCLERVKARRLERGNEKPLNPSNLVKDHHVIWNKVRKRCLEHHHQVKVLDWEDPLPQVIELLSVK